MIRVMVVDDSPLVRKLVTDILTADPEITVCATAATGELALRKLQKEKPDVITMDIDMPGMGGIVAMAEIMRVRPTAVIVLSALATRGADQTIRALEGGAVDFIAKPTASISGGVQQVARELVEKVKAASRINIGRLGRMVAESAMLKPVPKGAPANPPGSGAARSEAARSGAARSEAAGSGAAGSGPSTSGQDGSAPAVQQAPGAPAAGPCPPFEIVAIGASTGGPVALKTVLSDLPRDFPVGIVVVQHMPPFFTGAFAARLHALSALEVKEAAQGDEILPGRVLVAPGDRHMTVVRSDGKARVLLRDDEPVNGHRPSVDVLMGSVADEYGCAAVGVIMTGMGKDGARGIARLKSRGGTVIAQDAETSVIFGMNGEVVRSGLADAVVPVTGIAAELRRRLQPSAVQLHGSLKG
jgi:two-component system, chemotaxis family, protein-glutamate methylesterase/glutaminase